VWRRDERNVEWPLGVAHRSQRRLIAIRKRRCAAGCGRWSDG
jgi:hypothetical protein